MTSLGERGDVSARIHRVAQQPAEPGVGTIVATGSATMGDFGLFRGFVTPGATIAAHFHRTFSESLYVLGGTVAFFDGDRWDEVNSGDLVYVPPVGGVHGLRLVGDSPAEVLTIFTPGVAGERFADELLQVTKSRASLSPEEWVEFYRRHDQYML